MKLKILKIVVNDFFKKKFSIRFILHTFGILILLPHIEDHHTRGWDVEIEDGRNDLKSLFIFCLSTFLYFEQEIPQNTKNYQLEFPTGLTLKGTLAANSTLQTSSCDKHIKYDKCDKHITSSISLTRISQSTCHQV